jgi:hypothetical protein
VEIRGYYSLSDWKYKHWQAPLAGGGVQDRAGFMFANSPKRSGAAASWSAATWG